MRACVTGGTTQSDIITMVTMNKARKKKTILKASEVGQPEVLNSEIVSKQGQQMKNGVNKYQKSTSLMTLKPPRCLSRRTLFLLETFATFLTRIYHNYIYSTLLRQTGLLSSVSLHSFLEGRTHSTNLQYNQLPTKE